MKLRILTICILTSIYAFGQETVLKEKKGESYYVLKDNSKIKHGAYEYSIKKILTEKGQYENDKKIGVWEFYDKEGNLEQKYDYTLKLLLFNKEIDPRYSPFGGCKVIVNGEVTDIAPDAPPIFIGGISRYKRFIKDNLKYPEESKSRGIEGKQFVTILLSSQGEISSPTISKSILPEDIGKESLRLVSELPKEWISAKYQGKDVDCKVTLVMEFRLN